MTFRFGAQRLNHCATAVPPRVKEERRILLAIKLRKATSFIGHILRMNCQLKHVTEEEGRIEVTGRRGKRRKQVLDDLEEREDTGSRKTKRSISQWRTRFGRGYGPVVRQTTE